MFTSVGLNVPFNEKQLKKAQLTNSNNKIIDPTMNESVLNVLQEQVKQMKQSFEKILDSIKQKEQSTTNEIIINDNELSTDTKDLHEQVNPNFHFSAIKSVSFRSSNYVHC